MPGSYGNGVKMGQSDFASRRERFKRGKCNAKTNSRIYRYDHRDHIQYGGVRARPHAGKSFSRPTAATTVSVTVADTAYKQALGLMGREVLPADQGMLFVFYGTSPNFWMKDTYIPLDQIYIRSDGTVVDINKNARPLDTDLFWSRPCQYVVEVNGGYCDRHGIVIGDKVRIID